MEDKIKFKLNLVADKPTKNGRIYPKKELKECLSRKDIMVTLTQTREPIVNLSDVIGIANLSKFEKDIIEFDVKPIKFDLLNIANNKLLAPAMFGRVDRDNVIKDFHLLSFSPVMDTDYKE